MAGGDGNDGDGTPSPIRAVRRRRSTSAHRAQPDETRNLAADDDEADGRQVAADDGVGNVADQAPDADEAEQDLDEPAMTPSMIISSTITDEATPWSTSSMANAASTAAGQARRGADQAVSAAQRRGDEADHGGADDAMMAP